MVARRFQVVSFSVTLADHLAAISFLWLLKMRSQIVPAINDPQKIAFNFDGGDGRVHRK